MILGIGHYNDRKQAEFVSYLKAALEGKYKTRVEEVGLDSLPKTPKGVFVVTGIQSEAAAALVRERRGLLIKIIHPGVAPTTDVERALLSFDWDYILGVTGKSDDLKADAVELAKWLGGHACRPDQPYPTKQRAIQVERSSMVTTHSGMVHLNGHLLAAVDVETTGREPGWHEIIQIAIQPLDSRLEPLAGVLPFYQFIKPEYPEREDKKATAVHKIDIDWLLLHAPDKWKVAELLDEWWTALDLPHLRTLVPLAQNWQYEAGFLKAWLGVDQFHQFFHAYARDTMLTAIFLNDRAYLNGEKIPFDKVNLPALCRHYGVVNAKPHDALADAVAEAEVYKHMLREDVL